MKKLFKCVFVLTLSIILLTSCKDSSTVQSAVARYEAGEITEDSLKSFLWDSVNVDAAIEWAEKHKSDNIIAMKLLGRAYILGERVKHSLEKSKVYYFAAAKQGDSEATRLLGCVYLYPGQEKIDSARYWFAKAAERGDGQSYYMLSELERQYNASVDSTLVISYWTKGAQLNDASCLASLSYAYYFGWGVECNKKKAFMMLDMADENLLDDKGLFYLALMYELGEVTRQDFNTAFKFYKKAANKGNASAMCKLGNYYGYGQGVERNDSLAFIEYQKAANIGDAQGQRCVAYCYYYGKGTKQNKGTAYQWFEVAAKNGDEIAIRFCNDHNITM